MKATPLFPEIAQAEAETPPPFAPWVPLPRPLMADDRLKPFAKLVAAALYGFLARGRHECWPSNRQLADAIGASSERLIRLALEQLEAAGYIRRHIDPATKWGEQRRIEVLYRTFDPPSPEPQKQPKPSVRPLWGEDPGIRGGGSRDPGVHPIRRTRKKFNSKRSSKRQSNSRRSLLAT